MGIDWATLFVPNGSIVEIFVRGTVMYLAILAILRIVPRRQTGSLGVTDVLLITLLADASQNGLTGDYRSITEGIALVATVVFWNLALDWLAFHWPRFAWIVDPPALPLIRKGRIVRENLRRELVTEDALLGHLREKGVTDVSQVEMAFLESEGRISVIEKR
ncbi:MAG: DUF421 domain-containing protein [Candidatus Binatia bacterium]